MTEERVRDTLAKNIYGGIVDKGWTPAELARQSGLSRNEILSYMRGLSLPTSENLAKIAKALDVTPDELLSAGATGQD